MPRLKRSPATGLIVAIVATVLTAVARYLFRDILGPASVFSVFVLPIMVAGWFGGLWPALLATALGAAFAVAWFIPPLGEFTIESPADLTRLGLFLLSGSVISVLCESLFRAEARLMRAEASLRSALQGANVVAFELNVATGQMSRLAESPAGTVLGREYDLSEWLATIHPEDREQVRELIDSALAGVSPYFLAEYRSNDNPAREWCWQRTRAQVHRGPGSAPVTMSGVTMDISEHKRLEEALREADRRKDNYVAMLAHELRNPLAPIRNAVHLLKAEVATSPQAAFSSDVIDRQSLHMSRLLDDLLNVSRIARGTLELRREQVALRTILADAVTTSQPLIEARRHCIDVRLPRREVVMHADPARLAQVFVNLLANAARYTPDGGRIEVEALIESNQLVTRVKDNGIGIAPEQLTSIFELFSQGAPARDESREGMGIGLALAKSLVELHEGTITATSDGPGKGSEFVVRLPLDHVMEPDDPRAGEQVAKGRESLRILVADDSRDNANSLAELLRVEGHDVVVAYDGEEALAVAAEFDPRVMLLDLGMPRLDGFETCRRLRAMPSEQGMIIIALTGWGQLADRERTSAAGFDAHLVKPVNPERLLDLLNLLVQNNALPA